ncbi:undecaprenyl-diphosphatase UppP [Candidatus Kuenenbacteria bacterium CG11_big_fil_rev_8_21_14_0_20_37_9]|uniref:Undecaprenyl-diphosphatase n=2 Tax=Candidatus Kueneniibacteriota TaxID=1752740 RepID=A0A2M6XSA1_9BACT|nr:MAG: undecaprenyl-diphosphatase UppP [Candidatus Kuenenbacteria bacterium CG1_02_38_13]PIR05678.1 MAG: undecaprenyl-diphosphatase UppP [Candidatus Kuenenbacteria bacterium CG11_big_fil_rev_8_21_14_0_20_37_9]PIU10481.1 MAG: undecaprenyl-diphosphatase UppP [Candidatus Kuenenbacteria bacterium CG08_land_8_20_14_0_20_37_23]
MSITQSVILGLIQGITEFLPISSSGHLILVPKFFNWPNHSLTFDAILHLGTALAIIFALRQDIWLIIRGLIIKNKGETRKENLKSFWMIVLAVIPAGLIGFLFNNWIEQHLRSIYIVFLSLIFWGIFLWFSELYNNKQKIKIDGLKKISWLQALLIGLMQVTAFIPGTSRSGITISAGLFAKFDRETAVKFSFLIGLPVILCAGVFQLIGFASVGINYSEIICLVVGFFSALISGIFSIRLLLLIANKASFNIFVIYRILLGIVILLLL